jgi:hypothetical protein
VLRRGPRAEEAHRRLLVVISTVDPAVVASSPAVQTITTSWSVKSQITADFTCYQRPHNYPAGLKKPDLLSYLACRLRAGRTPTVQRNTPANNAGNISGRHGESVDCGSVVP